MLEEKSDGRGGVVPGLTSWEIVVQLAPDPAGWDAFEVLMGRNFDLDMETADGRMLSGEGLTKQLADVVRIQGSGPLKGFDQSEFYENG